MTTEPAEPATAASYTRDQVKQAERPAWARAEPDGPEEYYFDGAHFWHQPSYAGSLHVAERHAPELGWRHKQKCGCGLCGEPAPPAARA